MVTVIFKNKDESLTPQKFFNKVQQNCGFPATDMIYYDGKNDISMKIGRNIPINLGKYLKNLLEDKKMSWYLTVPHEENIKLFVERILVFASKTGLEIFTIKYKEWYVLGNIDDGVDILEAKIKKAAISQQVYREVYKQDFISILDALAVITTDWKNSTVKREQALASIGRVAMYMWSKEVYQKQTDQGFYKVTKKENEIIIEITYFKREKLTLQVLINKEILIRKLGDKTQKIETFREY